MTKLKEDIKYNLDANAINDKKVKIWSYLMSNNDKSPRIMEQRKNMRKLRPLKKVVKIDK
jgi:hypothetical protein